MHSKKKKLNKCSAITFLYLFAEKKKTTSINKKILTVIVNDCRYALFLFVFCLTIFYNYNKSMGKRKYIGFLKKLNSLVF